MGRPLRRNRVYCLQVLVAVSCALLPVGLQGHYGFVERGLLDCLLWSGLILAVWLRCALPVQLALPAVLAGLAYSGYVVTQRDDMGFNEVSAILNAKFDEVIDYVLIPGVCLPLCLVLLGFGVLSWALCSNWLRRKAPVPVTISGWLFYPATAAIGWGCLQTAGDSNIYPANLVSKGYQFLSEVQYAKRMRAQSTYTYAGPAADHCPPELTAVLVIGESARAASWSLYGYARPTTPEVAAWIGKAPGRSVVFEDALAAGRLTMTSVPSLLSSATARDFHNYCTAPSVLRVFRAAGYRTAVFSSQVRASEFWDGSVNLMLNDAASVRKLDADREMDAALDQWLERAPQTRQLAVLHLFGSHYIYSDRYPPEFNRFQGGNEMVDTYDNSIAYTDHVLATLIGRIESLTTPGVFFYTSDHGENLNDSGDGNIQHSCREFTRYEVEVPLVFFANAAFATAYPEKLAALRACAKLPVSHDCITQTLLGLAGLTDPQAYQNYLDLSSGHFAPQPRYLIKSLRETVAETDLPMPPHRPLPRNP